MASSNKKKILIYIRYYLPGYRSGGPVLSISNMVKALNHEYDFYIVCLSHDYGEDNPYDNVSGSFWKEYEGAKVLHLDRRQVPFASILKNVRRLKPDIVYFNSLLDPFFTFSQLWYYRTKKIKIIIAPRGELTPGALSLSTLRKKIYIYIFKKIYLSKKIVWHSTTEKELKQIMLNIGVDSSHVYTADNIPFFEERRFNQVNKEPGKLKIIFLSRVSPVKNLMYALDALKSCKSNIAFDIYGEIGDKNYWYQCERKIHSLPKNITVSYCGSISHDIVSETLSGYHLFFLPTLGENFGHAIFEALSVGIPVLISDQTPWTDVVNMSNYSAIPLNNQRQYTVFIEHLSMMENSDFINLKSHALEVFKKHIDSNNYTSPYVDLFSILNSSDKCITQ